MIGYFRCIVIDLLIKSNMNLLLIEIHETSYLLFIFESQTQFFTISLILILIFINYSKNLQV